MGTTHTHLLTAYVGCIFAAATLTACGETENADAGTDSSALNMLTARERDQGWELLFDGESTQGWRGYNKAAFPDRGWEVQDGNLVVLASDGSEEGLGGDIVTTEIFDNFELSLEFLVTPGANSGILYRIIEKPGAEMWENAPEFQVLDDSAYIAMGTMDMHKHLTGDNYDLHASVASASKPLGEWNHARILVDGGHVEHWLNGQKTVEYELWSAEWDSLVANSKFSEFAEYGQARSGPIGIQDHGHLVKYRNIKVRRLSRAISVSDGSVSGAMPDHDYSYARIGFAATRVPCLSFVSFITATTSSTNL